MRGIRVLPAGLAAVILTASFSASLSARLVDRIMAVVNNRVIALSDVELYRSLFAPDRDPDSVLGTIIDQDLLLAEARKFEIPIPSDEEIDREIRRMAESMGGQAALSALLRRLAVPMDNFRRMITENLRVDNLLDQRINSFVFVSNQEADDYYKEHADRFPGGTADKARPEIMEILRRKKAEARKGEYLERLRDRARIQIN